jgi:hypothetical protein
MPRCPKCAATLTEQEARSIWASYRSGRRKTIGRQGGRRGFRRWLETVRAYHGAAVDVRHWLTARAWPDPESMAAARECLEAWRAGDLARAEAALLRAQGLVEG